MATKQINRFHITNVGAVPRDTTFRLILPKGVDTFEAVINRGHDAEYAEVIRRNKELFDIYVGRINPDETIYVDITGTGDFERIEGHATGVEILPEPWSWIVENWLQNLFRPKGNHWPILD